jgi:hypothetical protein
MNKNNGIKVIDGVYTIYLSKTNASHQVPCEFDDNIGWNILQYRHNGSVNFNRDWLAYKDGFGSILNGGEFWLGLELIHLITNQESYS